MTELIDKIRLFYDPTREPLRRRVYTYLLAVATLAVAAGIISGSIVTGLVGPVATLLAVPVVESARSKVTPTADPLVDDAPGRHASLEVPE